MQTVEVTKTEVTRVLNRLTKFSYNSGEVNLNFSLSIDNSAELETFRQLLKTALDDVEAELQTVKEKEANLHE